MTESVTAIVPIRLAAGKTEADLLGASAQFQKNFVNHESGILRRELVRKKDGTYLDIVQFRSARDAGEVMEKEQSSDACSQFFAVIDMLATEEGDFELMASLETNTRSSTR